MTTTLVSSKCKSDENSLIIFEFIKLLEWAYFENIAISLKDVVDRRNQWTEMEIRTEETETRAGMVPTTVTNKVLDPGKSTVNVKVFSKLMDFVPHVFTVLRIKNIKHCKYEILYLSFLAHCIFPRFQIIFNSFNLFINVSMHE